MSKQFIINLDLDVELRYEQLIKSFDITMIRTQFNSVYNTMVNQLPFVDTIISQLVNVNQSKIMYYDEIMYWSNIFNMPFHKVLLMQLMYEINAGCTTFVKDNVMYRTMDWPMDFLKEMTYHGIFTKKSEVIYEAVCWLGSVGIFTGKTANYSVAINYRRINDFSLGQIINKYLNVTNMYWPVSYLLRHTLETTNDTDNLINNLKSAKLVSPVYYIVNDFNGKASIIMREPKKYTHIIKQNLVQTNCDNDKIKNKTGLNIMHSYERHAFVKELFNK